MAKSKNGANRFEQAASKSKVLQKLTSRQEAKGNLPYTALETVKDTVLIVAGGFLGAALGRPSMYVGMGIAAAGHFWGVPLATTLGIGMVASNGFQSSKSVEGLEGVDIQSVQKRVAAYKENLMEKTYLDKILHKKEEAPSNGATDGMGSMQFFSYGNEASSTGNELSALDNFERQLLQSAANHMRTNEVEGLDDIDGIEEVGGGNGGYNTGEFDVRDYNF
jgi:hypothetical protein